MRKLILIIAILVLMLNETALAYQFEYFEWGDSIEETKNLVLDKDGLSIVESNITYNDVILNVPCNVNFFFTPKSNLLYLIAIVWDTESVSSGLLALLTKKYGEPTQPNEYLDQYGWIDPLAEGHIILDYLHSNTTLFYRSGKYNNINEEEKNAELGKESHRF